MKITLIQQVDMSNGSGNVVHNSVRRASSEVRIVFRFEHHMLTHSKSRSRKDRRSYRAECALIQDVRMTNIASVFLHT